MFVFFKILTKILNLLNSETAPSQLAAGVCFGMIVGLSPFFTWHNLIIFLLVCFLRVNFSVFFLSSAFFAAIGYLMDPLFDWIGYQALVNFKEARPLWIYVSTAPVLSFFRFNNTVVLGSVLTSLILYIPVFIILVVLIHRYRRHWREKIKNSKWMKSLKTTKIYGLYMKYRAFRKKWERLV